MKTQLVLDALAEKEQVGVSDQELTERIISQAQQYGVAPQEFVQQLIQAGNLLAAGRGRAAEQGAGHRAGARRTSPTRPGRTVDLEHLRLPRPDGRVAEAEAAEDAGRRTAGAGRRPRSASATSIRPIGS